MLSRKRSVVLTTILMAGVLVSLMGCSTQNPLEPSFSTPDQTNGLTTESRRATADGLAAGVSSGPPAEGTVVEGVSAPGVALGETRAQVEAAYGAPDEATDVSSRYFLAGGGEVGVSYTAPDGDVATNSPDDIVTVVGWTEPVSGWVTTAGVNTTLANDDPDALVAAYPNAEITYTQWGSIYSVVDYEQGISIYRPWIVYSSGDVAVRMSIFNPRPAPPPIEKMTYVYGIDLTAQKTKGNRQIQGFVKVRDERQLAASGATVVARWIFPDGSTQTAESVTSSSGYAYFTINGPSRGTYTLAVDDVVLTDHRFDTEKSVLTASVSAK